MLHKGTHNSSQANSSAGISKQDPGEAGIANKPPSQHWNNPGGESKAVTVELPFYHKQWQWKRVIEIPKCNWIPFQTFLLQIIVGMFFFSPFWTPIKFLNK